MSTTELQRSTLESKDKDELTAIANAMGGKPGSRARKAEIIDLILQLAGVRPESEPASDGEVARNNGSAGPATLTFEPSPPAPEPAAAADGASSPPSPTAPPPDDAVREGGTPAAGPVEEAPAGQVPDVTRPTPDGQADNAARQPTSTVTAEQAPERQAGAEAAPSGDGATPSGDGAGPDQQAQHRARDDQRGDDQGETGNRRRRRRGRDRDRQGQAQQQEEAPSEPIEVSGHLDLRDEGYGFLRVKGYLPSKDDVYVSVKQARQFGLRKGDHLTGLSRAASRNEKNPALLRLDTVNGDDPEKARSRPRFEDLTPLFPDQKLRLERADDPTNMTCRIIDLIAPIGKGQRGLIVSPPKAGKTTIVKEIVRSIELNNPECAVIVLLVDERPEEVTDMRRWLLRGEVMASTFDRPADEHTQVAEMTIERAKRMVEMGEDVVIVLDGITRLARAYNLAAPATGRIMSGGVDSGALYPPKKFFGAARNVEEGGSLTILATALVETGSKMDEVIFEEFKGTGNMELRLDRRTAERRIYPAIDVDASSTRHEELLFERKQLQQVWKLRRVLSGLASDGDGGGAAGLELLIDRLKTFRDNDEFLAEVARGPAGV